MAMESGAACCAARECHPQPMTSLANPQIEPGGGAALASRLDHRDRAASSSSEWRRRLPSTRRSAETYLMHTGVPPSPTVIARAQGTRLYTTDGREILDFTSGQMSSLLGHSHPEVVEVVRKYVGELDHLLSNMITQPVVDLAERLGRILPAPLQKSFFLNTGSETTEAAIKMAKCYTGKFEIVAFTASYHGLTQGSGSATYSAGRRNGGPAMPGQLAFPAPYAYRSPFKNFDGSYDWETELDFGWSMIDRQSVGSLAAFIMEPILSTGGILDPPPGYLKRMVDECKKRNMLVIMDEAQTGIGRTGQMFAFERDEIVPDILCLSKTLGCGLPLASVSTTVEIERGCSDAKFLWLTTHLNDPLTAAVGNKVLEIVERDNMCQRAQDRGAQLKRGLERLEEKYWCIGDVRGRGLFQGIEIISDAETKAPGLEIGQAVSDRAMACGLSCNIVNLPGMGGVFRVAPPVTVSAEEIEEGLRILDEAFDFVLHGHRETPKAQDLVVPPVA
ncbi:PLP-dependent transferase [Phaeosphaeriaceae sp. SRC1lsM3a]|nr:PLP-dependent transferase [Stagonospora sp. SRC1lsM3a]